MGRNRRSMMLDHKNVLREYTCWIVTNYVKEPHSAGGFCWKSCVRLIEQKNSWIAAFFILNYAGNFLTFQVHKRKHIHFSKKRSAFLTAQSSFFVWYSSFVQKNVLCNVRKTCIRDATFFHLSTVMVRALLAHLLQKAWGRMKAWKNSKIWAGSSSSS